MTNPYLAFLVAAQGHTDRLYAPGYQDFPMYVTSIEADSKGVPSVAKGTIFGKAGYKANIYGQAVSAKEVITVRQIQGKSANGLLQFVGHSESNNAGVGKVTYDDLPPYPEFASPNYTEDIKITATSILTALTINLEPVEAKWGIHHYALSYRFTPPGGVRSDWIDQGDIPPLETNPIPITLSTLFGPGTVVQVKARSFTTWAGIPSEESSIITITTAADTNTPGSASGITVGVTTPGALVLQAIGSAVADVFAGWIYSVATSAGGAGAQSSPTLTGEWTLGNLSPGNYYVAVRPISKTGVLGTRWPSGSSYDGPYTVAGAYVLDTTAPTAFGAPTLTQRSNTDPVSGAIQYFVKVTLPGGYSFSADYAYTEVSMSDGVHPPTTGIITSTNTTGEWMLPPGTWTIGLRGVDQLGNRQGSFGTTANITITPVGTPATMSAPTVTGKVGALLVSWSRPTDAAWVQVERSDDAIGTNAVTYGPFDSTAWLDTLFTSSNTPVLPSYYYRVRAVNLDSSGAIRNGTYSSRQSGTVAELHGSWLGADTITAREILANTITANEIAATLSITGNTIQTAASGARVALSGPNNRFEVYSASALLAYLDGSDLRFLRDGNTAHPRTKFTNAGQYIYNDSDVLRLQLDKDGLLIANTSGGANRVQLQPNSVMQMFADDASSGFLIGYSGNPFGLFKTLVGGSVYTTGIWPNSTQGVVVSSNATQGGTPGAYLSLRPDGYIGFGNGANFADVLMGRMNGGYGLGLDLDQASFHAKDIYATRNGGTTGYVFLGDQSGGGRYIGWDNTNYVLPNASLWVNGTTYPSSLDYKGDVRNVAFKSLGLRSVLPKIFKRKRPGESDVRPDAPDELGYIFEEMEQVDTKLVVRTQGMDPLPGKDEDDNARHRVVTRKGLDPMAILSWVHLSTIAELDALASRLAIIEAKIK